MVTVQVPEVVPPTVTVAVEPVPILALDVCLMAMVSLAWKPTTVVPLHTPLRAMAVQLAQVAVREPVNPERVTALLVTVVFVFTPV